MTDPKEQISARKRNLLIKYMVEEAKEDRKLALEAADMFRNRLVDSPHDKEAAKGLTESLKLAQTAKTTLIKLVELSYKVDFATPRVKAGTLPGRGSADYNMIKGTVGKIDERFPGR